jgi:CRISPR-associated protein Csm1
MARRLRDAPVVSWSPEAPARVVVGEGGKHTWPLGSNEGIPYARHTALDEEGHDAASLAELSTRAVGRPVWGVLRGDVDNIGIRIRRAQSIEEHVQLSTLYKQFFAGELEVLCSMPEFWRKVTLLYSGGDDFAVYGSWDALVSFARELQRLFVRFTEDFLKVFPGPEGKTISMGLALARDVEESLAGVYEEAGNYLEVAKSSGKDCIFLLGRTIDWKLLGEASDTKSVMTRMIKEFQCSPQFLYELASFYREAASRQKGRGRNDRIDKPWRFHRRLNMVIDTPFTGKSKNKEFQKLRSELISDFTGRRAAQIRLRPAGRVALEWAKLEAEA